MRRAGAIAARTRGRGPGRALVAARILPALAALLLRPVGAGAQASSVLDETVRRAGAARPQAAGVDAGVRATPGIGQLGERILYRGWVYVLPGREAHFQAPDSSADLVWGQMRQGRARQSRGRILDHPPIDSVWVEAPLQLFATGARRVSGLVVHVQGDSGPVSGRLPTVTVTIQPQLTAADSNAQLRAVRGPLAAPWWERISWRVVIAVALWLAALIWFIVWLRRRSAKPIATPALTGRAARRRPAIEEALQALAALRAEKLPERGQFPEHALKLTRLLRVYLERGVGATLPGDTSPELLERLRGGAVLPDDLEQLSGLLGVWDRVKFARAPFTVAESERAEGAVESFLRRHSGVPSREVA